MCDHGFEIARAAALLCAALAIACGSDEDVELSPSDSATRPLPWPASTVPAPPEPATNPTTEAKTALGRVLFYDPILSTDREVACATCHSEIWGLSDGLAVSVGVDGDGPTGPGRDGPNVTRRNSPTLWNVAFKSRLFWDGRAASLEEQALRPLETPEELGRDPEDVVADLRGVAEYRELFAAAFPADAEPVTADNLARAIAAFERTFVSDFAPYDRYVAGDAGALSAEAVSGMFLFDELGCASCHVPPLFDSERYEDRGVPGRAGVTDEGRMEVTGVDSDKYRFRVPTLRNLPFTAPYFHSGEVDELADAVALEAARATRPLEPHEVDAIVAFLRGGLMDVSREPDRPASVPSGLPVPADGFRIPR